MTAPRSLNLVFIYGDIPFKAGIIGGDLFYRFQEVRDFKSTKFSYFK